MDIDKKSGRLVEFEKFDKEGGSENSLDRNLEEYIGAKRR